MCKYLGALGAGRGRVPLRCTEKPQYVEIMAISYVISQILYAPVRRHAGTKYMRYCYAVLFLFLSGNVHAVVKMLRFSYGAVMSSC
jgi:hypothetical protein